MTLTEHLAELRSRLIRCVVAVMVGFFVAYVFHEELFAWMARPVLVALRAHGIPALQALQVTETITVYLQVSLVAALIGTAPYLFYQAWAFVAPGLYANERRLVRQVTGLVSGFFFLGVLFCYAVFLPLVVDYLVGFTQASGMIHLLPTVQATFSLVTLFPLVFGILFQLPLVMFLLALLGVIHYRQLWKVSRYFVVLAFVLGAVFTPPDPLSQVLLAVPITVLFFVGVAFAWVGGLLREGGRRTVARVVAVGVVLAFASLVVASAVLWNLPRSKPDPAAQVPDSAWYAVRADPGSRLGQAALRALRASVEEDALWVLVSGGRCGRQVLVPGLDRPSEQDEAGCLGAGDTGDPRSRDEPALGDGPVSALIRPPCLARLAPQDLGQATALVIQAVEETSGLVRVVWTVAGQAGAWRAWAERNRDNWTPVAPPRGLEATPLGRSLAWSAGDIEVAEAQGRVVITLTLTPVRAARSISEVLTGLMACGVTEG